MQRVDISMTSNILDKCPKEAQKLPTTDKTGAPICVCKCSEGKKYEGGKCVEVNVCGCPVSAFNTLHSSLPMECFLFLL